MIIKKYVQFSGPWGAPRVREIKSRDIKTLKIPKKAYAFFFFDVASVEENGIFMKSERLEISPTYYYGGRIMTIPELRREIPNSENIISTMQSLGIKHVIKCRTVNTFELFGEDDKYIEV